MAKSPVKSPPLRKPKHGRGLLRVGGTNKGGTGRPPSAIRAQLRGSFADRVKTLEQFADGYAPMATKCSKCGHEEDAGVLSVAPQDRLRAIDMLAKYGLGTMKEVSVESVRERVQQTLLVIRSHCAPEQATAIVEALRPVWA